MTKLAATDLMPLEQYARERGAFRERVLRHKATRRLAVGPNSTWIFEDRLTVQYQVQEMLRTERIFEPEGIVEELAAYNPLIPDGSNWKVTLLLEFEPARARRGAGGPQGRRGPLLGAGARPRARARHRRRGPAARECREDRGGAFPALRAQPGDEARRCTARRPWPSASTTSTTATR